MLCTSSSVKFSISFIYLARLPRSPYYTLLLTQDLPAPSRRRGSVLQFNTDYMDYKASNPPQTNITPDPSLAELRRCVHCRAEYPVSHYGLFKPDPKGLAKVCKPCRTEINQTKWTRKHGRKRPLEPAITRSVIWQNRQILDIALSTTRMEFRAFDFITKVEYKVFYGPSERLGLNALTLFTRNGMVFMEWALSGVSEPRECLMAYLKAHNLRLELDDSQVIAAKTLIYYL